MNYVNQTITVADGTTYRVIDQIDDVYVVEATNPETGHTLFNATEAEIVELFTNNVE